ncbi:MAG: universal stress protein [Acidobacteriia bacterium]|nr:universal stress protein [Terriglobia bacterium]
MTQSNTEIAILNVLLATDFSAESVQAVDCARRVCNQHNAKLFVVHVMDVFPFALSDDHAAKARIKEIRGKAEAQMKDFVRANHLEQSRVEPALIEGEPSTAIEKFIREHEIDLIVLGSRGDTGISRLFEGSMAEEVFRTAQCPVMIVGPEAKAQPETALFNRLLFATDLSRFSKIALPYIEFLLDENPSAKLTLAHFVEQEVANVHERHQSRRRLEHELTEMIGNKFRSQIQDVVVESSAPHEGMLKMAEGLNADLLVLGVRSGGAFTRAATHGFCSTAIRVISEIPCPVLTVRTA